jgi:hypothetical protein
MKSNLIRFEVGAPRLGWSQVRVTYQDFKLAFLASKTPWDSIGELADAALAILAERKVGEARWHMEPGAFLFRLLPRGDRTALEILEFVDWKLRRAPRDNPVFRVEFETKALASSIWRALRRLEGSVKPEAYENEWRHPFPGPAIKRLGDALRAAKEAKQDAAE